MLLTCPKSLVVVLFLFPTCSHPLLARSFLDTIEPAGVPACSAGEWGGVPSVPELCFFLVSLRPLGGLPHRYLLRVFSCLFPGYLFVFFSNASFAHVFLSPICSFGDAFSSYFLCAGLCDLFSFHYCFRDASYECFCFSLRFPAFT